MYINASKLFSEAPKNDNWYHYSKKTYIDVTCKHNNS